MNLLDLKTLDWSQSCLDACGPNLRDLLGPPIASTKSLGSISNYMVERFGFDDNCLVAGKIKDFLTHFLSRQTEQFEVHYIWVRSNINIYSQGFLLLRYFNH